ncbi:MAG: SMP-30/gluconolactonase/LRE family protein [Comamonadaceae bacterium]|jgi:gluconolactonase|nr:SMP-30/gluconolactonase/LRE family protein [Comamonadaceae bacterium]
MLTESFEIIDPRFARYAPGNVHLERLASGCRWSEGPVYLPAGRYLLWSDIPNNRVMRWDETDGSVSVFQSPSANANGHTLDRQGRVISCEHLGRCVSRIEHDGSRTVLASHFKGQRLNSPNDVVVKSDDSIWFTDPTYGIDSDYEGEAAPSQIGASHVYRIDGRTGQIQAVVENMEKPNGLAFSPDEKYLYVVDTGVSHRADGPRDVRRYALSGDARSVQGPGHLLASATVGLFDGLRVDVDGNLWLGAGDGVHCLDPQGDLIGKIRVPEVVANVCFGGPKRNRLFICGTQSLYSIYVRTCGATWPTA